jgi:hypothetical protein
MKGGRARKEELEEIYSVYQQVKAHPLPTVQSAT